MLSLLDIDPSAAAPIWRQIEEGMRRLVASGALPVGSAVPSVRELARELRINPATVSKAYRKLTADGALEVRRGEGTFVAARPAEAVAAERERLLAASAERFVEGTRSMGVSKNEAQSAVSAAWDRAEKDDLGEKR